MRILIISDIHANLTAFETVLDDAGSVDAVWCLGDIVGYGPDPNECVEKVSKLPNLICLLGNHDAAAIGEMDIATFNPEARRSLHWMRGQLKPGNVAYLKKLPKKVEQGQVTLVHGSPRSPVHEYLLDAFLATQNFDHFETEYCFVGHTHLPVQYRLPNGQSGYAKLSVPETHTPIQLKPRAILNPGSVGQPRDRDSRASYALYDPDSDTWENRRVEYDIAEVQSRMRGFNLPPRHIERLAGGW